MDYKIRAFGACMIGGFPHRYEDSCFHLAIERLRQASPHNLIPSIYTMGGFPVTRILKHLQPRCLANQPDIVVVQFGSSDLIVPVRRAHHGRSVAAAERKVSPTPASIKDQLKWFVRGIIGDALRLAPVTSPENYLETLSQITRTIAENKAIPVVLSPFVLGGHRSDRLAHNCVSRLRQVVAAVPKAHYVEAYSALDRHPRRQMLLGDGTHLSLQGQAVVGECLFATLAKIIGDTK